MPSGKDSRELVWIGRKLSQSIDPANLESILYFPFLWNLFEAQLFDKDGKFKDIEDVVKELPYLARLDTPKLNAVLEYFQRRYGGEEGKNNFRELKIPDKYQKYVLDGLNGNPEAFYKVVSTLVMIVFRLRNNYFHGTKSLRRIGEQQENFRHANLLLMQILDLEEF